MKKMMMKNTTFALGITTATLLTAVSAQAATYTNILPPPSAWSLTHEAIFENLFGGDFVQAGNDFSNGVVDLTRVSDDDDQSYEFATWSAEALAVYAHATQQFGTEGDGILFNVTGGTKSYESNPVGGSISNVPGGSDIKFIRDGLGYGTVQVSTSQASNPGGLDQVVTYKYTADNQTFYLLFFEDIPEGGALADWDYNDLVVRVSGTTVPEPSALALMGLGGLAMLRRRR